MLNQISPVSADSCHYTTYQWDATQKKSVNHKQVVKDYSELDSSEIDQMTGCSVCEEDQRQLTIGDLRPVRVCKHVANVFEHILREAISSGFEIRELSGYRVGKTRGPVDEQGLRTQFSNHAFGIALDINAGSNGLYANCVEFTESCELLRGGHWRPGLDPASMTSNHGIVKAFDAAGFKWGGKIFGRQKDFMHFSPTGY